MALLPFKAKVLGAYVPVQEPQAEVQVPHSLGGTITIVIILSFVGHPPGITGLDCTVTLPLLLSLLYYSYL